MKANETNFITLIKQRDEKGILYVIDTYGGYLRSIVRHKLNALPHQIDECMDDIFLGIWKNIDSYDPDKGSFLNWIAGIARLESIDYLRKQSREYQSISLDNNLDPSYEDSQLNALIDKELSEEISTLLSCLSKKDQELFYRIYGNEETPEHVSSEFGITKNNLYVRLLRGKRKIRAYAAKRERSNEA